MDLVIQLEPAPLAAPSDGVEQHMEPPSSRRDEPRNELPPRRAQPKTGLLSQTMIPSPIIQWILPVRLRSRHLNDVAFIGERGLQIKEVVSGIQLEVAIAKTDFDANIIAAKIINVSTELPLESQIKLGAGNTTAATDSQLDYDSPPQILILSLDSRELVFLYYSGLDSGQFIHYRRPLPLDVSSFERFGRHVAVDPRSRAVAVSAPCDYVGIFMLKPPLELQSQMARGDLDPISEEHFFHIEGDILFMEFLYPTPDDGNRIILLLLISREQRTYAVCYDWLATHALRSVTPRIVKRALPEEFRLPSIVVPSTMASSFILATSASMITYKNRLDPSIQPTRYQLSIPDRGPQRSPLCTRWARPLRNSLHNKSHDDIYLCHEDGTIFYVEIGKAGDVENQFYLGQLDCDVDTAFNILDIGHEGADLILAAGNMGDGGLFIQEARGQPKCVQRFMNWSPVTDSTVVTPMSQSSLSADTAHDRLFVCSASTVGQGGIVELRHGIEAQIGLVIPLEELLSVRDIWAMTDSINGGVHILTSDPESSLLFHLRTGIEDEISAVDELDSGLDFSVRTLAAGCTPNGIILQVTEKAIRLGVANELPNTRIDYPDQTVTAAAVNESASLIITALRSQHGLHLQLTTVISSGAEYLPQLCSVRVPVQIDEDPICALIGRFGSSHFVFIGTGNGNVLTYRVDQEALTFLSSTAVEIDNGDEISTAIESLASVDNVTSGESMIKSTLFCGLRCGILVPFETTVDGDATTIEMKQAPLQRLGQTSVKVQRQGKCALAICGEAFWQVSCMQHGALPEYTLQRILIADQNDPAYYPTNVQSFTVHNAFGPNSEDPSNSLFCIADGQLLICTLGQVAKAVPRRISLPGSASRVTYSKHLNSLVVAYTTTKLDTSANPIKRFTHSHIEFVDPDSQEPIIGSVDGSSQLWRPQGAAGEKITCVMEWMPEKAGQAYHFIVIGTARKNQEDRGRVIFLQAARDPSNPSQIKCAVKYIHKFEGPVHSIAPYGKLTLMVSSGNDIVPLDTKLSDSRTRRITRYSLLSPAVSITVREPYLYVSTARQSLVVLKVSDDRLVLHAHDRTKLDGLSHVQFNDSNLSITSGRGGRVSVLNETRITQNDKLLPAALAEAHLPVSVMKLITATQASPSSFPHVIYGTTITGAVYRFLILSEKEWRLLRLLQNLCIRDPTISPFTLKKKRPRNPVEAESSPLPPSRMHVDGDILGRLAERGAGFLQQMLNSGDLNNPLSIGKGVPSAIFEHFATAVHDLWGKCSEPEEEVMRWLRGLLHPGF